MDSPSIKTFASVVVLDDERMLLVREAKPHIRGLWNIPGGHLEYGESIEAGARRELLEESGLDLALNGILGVYTATHRSGVHSVRFVFLATMNHGTARAGDEIEEVDWALPGDLSRRDDKELVSPGVLKAIALDVVTGVRYSKALLREQNIDNAQDFDGVK